MIVVPRFSSPKDPALVAFGHSYVQGDAARPVRPTWPQRAARRLGLAVDNRGVSGATSTQTLKAVRAYAPRAADVVVIETETNDVRRRGRAGLARYARNLTAMLAHLTRGTRPKALVVLLDPRPIRWRGGMYDRPGQQDRGSDVALAAYGRETRTVAGPFKGVVVDDLEDGWRPEVDVSRVDTLHPDEAGVRRIAAAATTTVGRALRHVARR